MSKKPTKQGLKVQIKNDQLVISIGIATLCYAVSNSEQMYGVKINNEKLFAKELMHELGQESEDGSTGLHALLDDAAYAVVENGSNACELVEDDE